ncbi:MAG: methylated-DNA-protein-cysteine methyltransferase related protein [Tenuifilum sp.]|jgi:methylated-DNA-protein-cysteine methyltransferase-like protein|uniref:MGMT family protein n=1 Tax=Tenuifilum thalassicum TaxID=2590900 RepID=A0A7D3XD78_9BACT|nr:MULTISPECIES: MGMT family protein [Tenuifilum]MDI3525887.1 methylated-DNA-protein-cysteine methyltransferase related protein [Tenuifilum sp.]QKG78867.1 MGMT family protein [Tenuifilum thalassicum]
MNQLSNKNDNFFERVYEVTRLIPFGRVTSYGAIARYLGSARSARMVGWALNSSVNQKEWVPAHRVVNRNGLLTGKIHFPGQNTMKELLESEGIKVENNRVVNFEELFWDPNVELG